MSARAKSTVAEFGIAIAIVLAVQAIASVTQERIAVNQGRGFDGAIYYQVAEQFRNGERPSHTSRFAKRIGAPFLASRIDPGRLIEGFLVLNAWGASVSSVLLLVWLRMFLERRWLRLLLVALFATHWLQLVRFTFFYPVLVDPWAQACCFAGLIGIAWYGRTPGPLPVLLVTIAGVAGVFFRELVLLVPLAFLFAGAWRLRHRARFPYVEGSLPGPAQWIPLALTVAAFVWIGEFVVPEDPEFSAADHLGARAYYRSLITFSLGWLVAFAPGIFVVLYDWRTTTRFFARHRAFLVFMVGVAALGWVASREAERHALNWGAPIVYVLLGLSIERHAAWFRSRGLLALLLAAHVLVGRVFVSTPQADPAYEQYTPAFLLTPLGDGATYLHLFPDYLPVELAWLQLGQFAVLGAIALAWLSRRAYLESTRGSPS